LAAGHSGWVVAVGDYDNDGWPDIFVTSYGNCILYRNNHDGTFTDVTKKAGLATPGWTTSAVWFDYDNDGRLDLFLCSFVDYGKTSTCSATTTSTVGATIVFPDSSKERPVFFITITATARSHERKGGTDHRAILGKGLGVVATDVNNDGQMDLFVANDTVQNFLYLNRGKDKNGKWQFEETALAAGVAYGEDGRARSGMGVDAADVFGSGYQDLFVANVDQEMFSLYRNQKNETFRDAAHENGVAQSTRLLSGWGLKFFDYDNDGAVDLILANGHPDDMIENYAARVKYKETDSALSPGERQAARRECGSGPCVSETLFGAGHWLRRFQQRRVYRYIDRDQWRRSPVAKESSRKRKPLARPETRGSEL
jgi:hypothetical protein